MLLVSILFGFLTHKNRKDTIVVIISQYIQILNHYVMHLKIMLYATSAPFKKNSKLTKVTWQ